MSALTDFCRDRRANTAIEQASMVFKNQARAGCALHRAAQIWKMRMTTLETITEKFATKEGLAAAMAVLQAELKSEMNALETRLSNALRHQTYATLSAIGVVVVLTGPLGAAIARRLIGQ